MANHVQTTVEPAENQTRSGSKANRQALFSLFSSTPYYNGNGYDAAEVKRLGQLLLLDGEVNDMGHTFGVVNRDYDQGGENERAPSYADVPTGGAGLPASAWVPNPSSPTGGVNNVGSIPAAPDEYGTTPADNWGNGVGSQLSPAESSAAISGQRAIAGQLPPSRSS